MSRDREGRRAPRTSRGRAATASVALLASGFSAAEPPEIQAGGQTSCSIESPPFLTRVAAPREISICEKSCVCVCTGPHSSLELTVQQVSTLPQAFLLPKSVNSLALPPSKGFSLFSCWENEERRGIKKRKKAVDDKRRINVHLVRVAKSREGTSRGAVKRELPIKTSSESPGGGGGAGRVTSP